MADVIASDDIGDVEKMMSQLLFHLKTNVDVIEFKIIFENFKQIFLNKENSII